MILFDFSFFTEVPNLLITGGILLLVIALVLVIVQGKKGKKAKVDAAMADTTQASPEVPAEQSVDMQQISQDMNMQMGAAVADPMAQPVMPEAQPVEVQPVEVQPVEVQPMAQPEVEVQPVAVEAPQVEVQPQVETAQPIVMPEDNTGTMNDVKILPTDSQPVDATGDVMAPNAAQPMMPEAQPVAPVAAAPVVEAQPVAPAMPEVQPAPAPAMPEVAPAPVAEAQPTIYGGASPAVGDIQLSDNQPHQIYGGADPLENTQPVPQVQPVMEAPVAAPAVTEVAPAVPEIAPAAPVVEAQPVAPAMPEVQPVPAAPEVAPAVPQVQPVEEQPAVPTIQAS